MEEALFTYLSIGGLTLDMMGAAFLAYDVLHGPEARLQAAIRHNRLAIARRNREPVSEETLAELEHFQLHDLRARRLAFVGLMLLVIGFACQGLASLLATPVAPCVPAPPCP